MELMFLVVIAIAVLLAYAGWLLYRTPQIDPDEAIEKLSTFNFGALASLMDQREATFLRQRLPYATFFRIHIRRMYTALLYLRELDAAIKNLRTEANEQAQLVSQIRLLTIILQCRVLMSMAVPQACIGSAELREQFDALNSLLNAERAAVS
jgi:hypothetical protein